MGDPDVTTRLLGHLDEAGISALRCLHVGDGERRMRPIVDTFCAVLRRLLALPVFRDPAINSRLKPDFVENFFCSAILDYGIQMDELEAVAVSFKANVDPIQSWKTYFDRRNATFAFMHTGLEMTIFFSALAEHFESGQRAGTGPTNELHMNISMADTALDVQSTSNTPKAENIAIKDEKMNTECPEPRAKITEEPLIESSLVPFEEPGSGSKTDKDEDSEPDRDDGGYTIPVQTMPNPPAESNQEHLSNKSRLVHPKTRKRSALLLCDKLAPLNDLSKKPRSEVSRSNTDLTLDVSREGSVEKSVPLSPIPSLEDGEIPECVEKATTSHDEKESSPGGEQVQINTFQRGLNSFLQQFRDMNSDAAGTPKGDLIAENQIPAKAQHEVLQQSPGHEKNLGVRKLCAQHKSVGTLCYFYYYKNCHNGSKCYYQHEIPSSILHVLQNNFFSKHPKTSPEKGFLLQEHVKPKSLQHLYYNARVEVIAECPHCYTPDLVKRTPVWFRIGQQYVPNQSESDLRAVLQQRQRNRARAQAN